MRRDERDLQFEQFYAAEAANLQRLGALLVGDRERGSDLAQEALLRAYGAWHRITSADPGPYVRRILVNLSRSDARRRVLERTRARAAAVAVEDHSGRVAEHLRVAELLQELPPRRRAALVLRYFEDRSEAEIAQILDRPIGTVKSDIHRALAKLRPLVDDSMRERR